MNGWTPERRTRQSALIQTWRPWEKAAGPKSDDGKVRVSRNAYKGGTRRDCGSWRDCCGSKAKR